jgi:hypothetical protein
MAASRCIAGVMTSRSRVVNRSQRCKSLHPRQAHAKASANFGFSKHHVVGIGMTMKATTRTPSDATSSIRYYQQRICTSKNLAKVGDQSNQQNVAVTAMRRTPACVGQSYRWLRAPTILRSYLELGSLNLLMGTAAYTRPPDDCEFDKPTRGVRLPFHIRFARDPRRAENVRCLHQSAGRILQSRGECPLCCQSTTDSA